MPLHSRNSYDDIVWASACTVLLFKESTSDKCTQICYLTPCCGGDPAACQDPCDQALEDCADYAAANTGTTCLAQCASARFTDVLYCHLVVYGISVLDCCSNPNASAGHRHCAHHALRAFRSCRSEDGREGSHGTEVRLLIWIDIK